MVLKSVIKQLIWQYSKSRLGMLGEGSSINYKADIRGKTKNIFIGSNTTISQHASLEVDTINDDESKIVIGNHTLVSSFTILRTYGGIIKIGDFCFLNSFSVLYGHGNLLIGDRCLIAPQVTIVPANYGFKDRNVPFREQLLSKKGITIEDDVWIGAGVTILDGCTIGKGSIIGAGSVLTKSVDPYSIVAGIPARKIGSRDE